jgi:hypothetical protein
MPKRKSKNWRNGNFGSIIRSEASIPKIEQSRSLERSTPSMTQGVRRQAIMKHLLAPGRTQELQSELLAAGIPL